MLEAGRKFCCNYRIGTVETERRLPKSLSKLVGQELPPDPSVLLSSLRGIGYSVEDAVADIVDNGVSVGARTIKVRIHDEGDDVTVDIADDGEGLDVEALLIAMRMGAPEKDPSLTRAERDLGRFGLGLKTASFSVARRLALYGIRNGVAAGAAWDLDEVAKSRRWQLSPLTTKEERELAIEVGDRPSGTVVRWSKCDRLGIATTRNRTAALAVLEERIRQHLALVYNRFLDGADAEGQPLDKVSIQINGRAIAGWNPLVPFAERPELVELGEPRLSGGMRVEYAVLPPETLLKAEEQEQATIEGRRFSDMQGFYVYRGNRLVCFASWLGLPGLGGGRWQKDSSTQLARIAVDLTNASDEEWSLDVRKSRVAPPERAREVLVEVGTEARLRSRARLFGRASTRERSQSGPLPSLWVLDDRRLTINREHPLVGAVVNPAADVSSRAVRAAARSLLRQLENSPTLVALISEPSGKGSSAPPSVATLDDADLGEALDLGRCLLRACIPMDTVLEIAKEDPRYSANEGLLDRLRARLERQ